MTLVEVLIASTIMGILMLGVMGTVMQSRRLTEGSILQNSAINVVQGFLEQIKNMPYGDLTVSPDAAVTPVWEIPTMRDEDVKDYLSLSWGDAPTTLPAIGTTPTNAVTNQRDIPIKYPQLTPNDTLSITIWVWVKDLTGASANVTQAKSVTMIYTYTFRDGGRLKQYRGQIRNIRSVVPSY